MQGPQRINGYLQRTGCPLLINADENDELKVFRAGCDMYPYNYSISDLPEIPLADKEQQKARFKMCNSGSYENIQASMEYNESI